MATALACLFFTVSFPGCEEEILEACPVCGLVDEGAVNISGEPRLDGLIDAVQRVNALAKEIEKNFYGDLDLLVEAFDGSFDPKVASLEEIESFVQKIHSSIFENSQITVTASIEPVECWVDTRLAYEAVLSCQKFLLCFVSQTCEQAAPVGSCSGLCVGECTSCNDCFSNIEYQIDTDTDTDSHVENEECLNSCVGTCINANCHGICLGQCSGSCSSYDNNGDCSGYCSGYCNGLCDFPVPYSCDGACLGRCKNPDSTISMECECRSDCAESSEEQVVCSGNCRGHSRPLGCEPQNCEDSGLEECREMAKHLAWSAIKCEPARFHFGVKMSSVDLSERNRLLSLVRLIEGVLARTAQDHAKLSLLIDGNDDAKEMPLEALEEDDLPEELWVSFGLEYLKDDYSDTKFLEDAHVSKQRKYLPLESLKARIAWLSNETAQRDYKIATGINHCIEPAFDDAYKILDTLLPVVMPVVNNTIEPDRTGGLYKILDSQAALLSLARGNF